jgi:uncharacterized membrane protein YdjX (TVP38/TMEM64 family)
MPDDHPPKPSPSWLARSRAVVTGLGPAGPWLLFAGGGPLLGFFVCSATHTAWLPWFGADLQSVLVYWGAGALLAGLCLIPTQVTSLVAGYLFGAVLGAVVAFAIVLVAALLGFGLWSRVVGSRVVDAIGQSEKARQVHRALVGRSFWQTMWLISLLRLSPIMPFAATNLLMASFGVSLRALMCATVIGVAPRLLAVSVVGAELSELSWGTEDSHWMTVLALVATVAVLALISRIARKALREAVVAE